MGLPMPTERNRTRSKAVLSFGMVPRLREFGGVASRFPAEEGERLQGGRKIFTRSIEPIPYTSSVEREC